MRLSRTKAAILAGSLLLPGLALANDADSAPVSFDFEALFATRTASNGAWLGDGVGAPVATGSDLPFGWAPGIDVTMTVGHGDKDLDFRFLGGLDFGAADQRTLSGLWSVPTVPTMWVSGTGSLATTYTSSYNSIEANVAHPVESARLFSGLRGVLVNDALRTDMDFGGGATAFFTAAAATVGFGPQVGADARFGDDVFLAVDGRLAGLLTKSQLSMGLEESGGTTFNAAGDHWGWAGLLEAGVAVGAKVGPATSMTLGYRAIYLHNVATALATIPSADAVTGMVSPAADRFLIHAVSAGIAGEF